jgi:uncharacterized protein YlzI (FlbEa/FlbD family)
MKKYFCKPVEVKNDGGEIVSLQVAPTKINGVATTPDVCLLVGNGKKDIPVFFTPEQFDNFINQLVEFKRRQLTWMN